MFHTLSAAGIIQMISLAKVKGTIDAADGDRAINALCEVFF